MAAPSRPYGASIAVRSDVYRAMGGMDPLPVREDIAFVSKLVGAGFRLSHPLDVTVTVSARTTGRAPGGMADCLNDWVRDEMNEVPLLFECPDAIEQRLRRRRAIRDLESARPIVVSRPWAPDLSRLELARAARMNANSALIEKLARDDPDAAGTVPAAIAISELERRIADLRRTADAA